MRREGKRVQEKGFEVRKGSRCCLPWDPKHGKGSHGTLTLGTNFTTLKDLKKELGTGLLDSMCADRGITIKDLNDV